MGLRHLFEAAVEVSDLALGAGDDLAVEPNDGTDRAVGGRMGGADVENLGLEIVIVRIVLGGPIGHEALLLGENPSLFRIVILA